MSKCDFCDGKTIHPMYIGEGITTMATNLAILFGRINESAMNDGIRLVDGNCISWDNSSGEYAEMQCEINYCPFCGKELHGKGEEKP